MVDHRGLVADRSIVFYPTAVQLKPVNIDRFIQSNSLPARKFAATLLPEQSHLK